MRCPVGSREPSRSRSNLKSPKSDRDVGTPGYRADMTTKIRRVTESDLVSRRAEILAEIGLTDQELTCKVETGGLVGREWSAWSEIEDIDYLLAP